jgi:diguanylate cyclase (GGDEF)-like protein/PAS domain S-box-containing protein
MRRFLYHTTAQAGRATPYPAIGERIGVLALTQVLLALLLVFFDLVTWNAPQLLRTVALVFPALLTTGALYLLRRTRYAVAMVYLNLTAAAVLLASADPLSGYLSGATWVLFQAWPPLAVLTLRRPVAAALSVIIPVLVLSATALLQIGGVLSVVLVAPPGVLLRNLVYQVLLLIVLSVVLCWMGLREQRALHEALLAREQLDHELAAMQTLAAEKDQLNATLEQRVAERSAVAEQRAAELAGSEAALRHQSSILQSILDSIGDGVVVTDTAGQLLLGNPAATQILGDRLGVLLPSAAPAAPTIYWSDQETPCPPAALPTAVALRGGAIDNAELYVPAAADGPGQWLSVTARPLKDAQGARAGSVAVFRESSAAKQAAAALHASEERYALAARGANDGLWDWNLTADQVFFSPRWKAMLGAAEDEIGTTSEEWFGRLHPDDRDRVQVQLAAHARRLIDHFELEYRIAHKDGTYHWMLCRGLAVWDAANRATRMVGSQTDITVRRLAEERLRHDALHDTLTGLPNRTLFIDRLEHTIRSARRPDARPFAVLFLDLDRFKMINDSLGHLIGDELLVAIASRLANCLRPGDTVARLGGDEFTILLENLAYPEDAADVAKRLQHALAAPFLLRGQEVFTSTSIGITLSNEDYERPDEMLRDADTAMYQAKLRGKARHAVFDATMHAQALADLQLESDLHRALERDELRVYYQPIVALYTDRVVGFEALVRWQHPSRGLLLPGEFFPLAEETGLITALGQWVLRESCRQLADWQSRLTHLPPLTVSVNLSAKQLLQPDLVAQIAQTIWDTGLNPRQLKLEIIESALVAEGEAATTALNQLKSLGVQLSIDDFGTGYSSLSYLHRFPVDTIKIDRSFVSQLDVAGGHDAIITAIVTLARSLGMNAIAAGVETTAQRDQLKALHCEYGQGWLFARALVGDQATALVASLVLHPPRTPGSPASADERCEHSGEKE